MNIGPSIWSQAVNSSSGGGGGGGAFRSEADFVIYTESTTETLRRMGIASNTFTTLDDGMGTGNSQPRGCAGDEVNGKIYACLREDDEVVRMNLDGSSYEVVVEGPLTGFNDPYDIVTDPENGKAYFVCFAGESIFSLTMGGLTTDLIVNGYGKDLKAITMKRGGPLFVVLQTANEIHEVTLAGVTTNIYSGVVGFGGLAININGATEHLYFSTPNNGIRRMELDGSNETEIVSDPDGEGTLIDPVWLDVDDNWIYVGDNDRDEIRIYDVRTGALSSATSVPQTPLRGTCVVYKNN